MRILIWALILFSLNLQAQAPEEIRVNNNITVELYGETVFQGFSMQMDEIWYNKKTGELIAIASTVANDTGQIGEVEELSQVGTLSVVVSVQKYTNTDYILIDRRDLIMATDKDCQILGSRYQVRNLALAGYKLIWQQNINLRLLGLHTLSIKRDKFNINKMNMVLSLYRLGYGRNLKTKTDKNGSLTELVIQEGGVYPDAVWKQIKIGLDKNEIPNVAGIREVGVGSLNSEVDSYVPVKLNEEPIKRIVDLLKKVVGQSKHRVPVYSDALKDNLKSLIETVKLKTLYSNE